MSRASLTDKAIRALEDGELADGKMPGLCIRARRGRKYWSYRYSGGRGRRRPRIALGTYPEVSLKLARQLAAQFGAALAQGIDPAEDRDELAAEPTIDELFDRALEQHWRPRRKARTVKTIETAHRIHISPKIGRLRVSELSRKRVISWHQSIGKALPGSANRALAFLSRAMTLAIRWDMVAANPCKGVERFKERKIERCLSPSELSRLMATTNEMRAEGFYPPALAFVWFLIMTGMRTSEVLNMRWSDIDKEGGTVHLPDSKTGERRVPMSAQAYAMIDQLERRCEWVFPKQIEDAPIANPWPYWLKIRARAELDDVRLHDCRHTFGTLLAGKAPLHVVKSILGHSTITTTQRYLHSRRDQEHAALEEYAVELPAIGGDATSERST